MAVNSFLSNEWAPKNWDHDNMPTAPHTNYDRLMRPAWGTPEYQQFKDSGQTSFIGDNDMPDFNLGNLLGEFWGGKTTFGSNAPEHNTLGSTLPEHNTINYMGGDKSPFSISGINKNNTGANTAPGNNTGVLSNGQNNSYYGQDVNQDNSYFSGDNSGYDSGSYGSSDSGSYSDSGDSSFGTAEGLGGFSNSEEDDSAVSDF